MCSVNVLSYAAVQPAEGKESCLWNLVFISCDEVTQLQYCLEDLFERSNKLDFLSYPALSEVSDLICGHNSRQREG
jgi:hypothetical protein